MGFSLAGSHLIFFVASVIVAGAVAGVFTAVTFNISNSLSEKCDRVKEKLDTDFEIINDPEKIPLSGSYYLFYIKNTGGSKIETTNDTFQVFIDGNLLDKGSYYFSPSVVFQSEVTTLYIASTEISSGNHRLRIVGPAGVYDEFVFNV
ncbi:MAG: flagellar protein G [Thermoplasmata archaeon]|nr:flagellar protein G [Thermoplasmata archaeon]